MIEGWPVTCQFVIEDWQERHSEFHGYATLACLMRCSISRLWNRELFDYTDYTVETWQELRPSSLGRRSKTSVTLDLASSLCKKFSSMHSIHICTFTMQSEIIFLWSLEKCPMSLGMLWWVVLVGFRAAVLLYAGLHLFSHDSLLQLIVVPCGAYLSGASRQRGLFATTAGGCPAFPSILVSQ